MEPMRPFDNATPLLGDEARLRERMATEGYLFVPALVPHAEASALYQDILAICREHGWADTAGRAACQPVLEGHEGWFDVYDPLQKLEAFHALAQHPRIVATIGAIVQDEVLVHPRNIARITFPGAAHYTTPPHQDYVHIQGTPDTYTVWMPLCDCPIELGGLAVLPRSHTVGRLPVHPASGPGGVGVDTDDLGLEWRTQDMAAGDALIFHSHTVHRALPNASADRLRISCDYRYQAVSQPVVDDSLLPHYLRLTWDDIYQGWTRPELQYYWQRQPIRPVSRQVLA